MADFSNSAILAPLNWQDFERHSRVLFACELRNPNTQLNGRQGQAQHGVDIYGQRDGTGHWVGIQCKGKGSSGQDKDYGKNVTEAELKAELEKARKFDPPIKEFILITTAPDDAAIQKYARQLQEEEPKHSKIESVTVMGWGQLLGLISGHAAAIKTFAPDATPFTDKIISGISDVATQVAATHTLIVEQSASRTEESALIRAIAEKMGIPTAQNQLAISTDESQVPRSELDKHFNNQIDEYRDLIREGKPIMALRMLTKLRTSVGDGASNQIKFRIIANMGSAEHTLRNFPRAADLFLEASELNGTDPVAITNKIAALIIKGRKDEAKALAVEARATHPNDINIAIQRIQARSPDEKAEQIWEQYAPDVKANVGVVIAKLAAQREDGDASWTEQVKAARVQYPDDPRMKLFEAEAILDTIIQNDPSSLGRVTKASPSQSELNIAFERFRDNWQSSQNQDAPKDLSSAHNAALALVMLGKREEAAAFLDSAFGDSYDREETKRLRLMLYKGAITPKVLGLADSLEDIPMNRVIRAETYAETQPEKAREILEKRDQFTEKRDIIAATHVVVGSYASEKKFQEAAQEAQRLIDKYPDDPHPLLLMYRVLKNSGIGDGAPYMEKAQAALKPETEFPIRFLVADALGAEGRFNDVVNILDGFVETSHDTPALQLAVASAINADRRKVAGDLLSALTPDLASDPFYRKGRVAFSLRTGDMAVAEKEIRLYIADKPRDLEFHLRLLQLLQNTGRMDELKAECAKPALDFDGSPEHVMQYAVFKDAYGDWREAHALAYQTLLPNATDQDVNFLYVAVFMRPGASKELKLEGDTVAANSAVSVVYNGEKTIYVIEPEKTLRQTARHLAPDHPTAQLLIGKSKGNQVTLPGGETVEIEWIKPKELHVFHDILASFPNVFPDMNGLEKVQYTPGAPNAFEPIFDRLRTRNDTIENISRAFQEGRVTIAAAAAMTSSDPVETMCGMITAGVTIRSCDGSHPERALALSAIKENAKKGCVVDAATLHVIMRLGLQDAVAGVCGPVGIVERTMTEIQKEILEIEQRQNETDLTLFWRDGQVFRHEITPAEKIARLEQLKADRAWLQANANVLPATGTKDLPEELREMTEKLGTKIVDDYLAAQGSDRLFVSVDQISRILGQTGFGLKTAWPQPIMMQAIEEKFLTLQQYGEAIKNMIGSRFGFISIDPNVILWSLEEFQGHELPQNFKIIASRLGGPTAELSSHVNVIIEAIQRFRQISGTTTFQVHAATGTLLDRLCTGQPMANIYAVIKYFKEFGAQTIHDLDFIKYINAWIVGHFFPTPKDQSIKELKKKSKKRRHKNS